MARINNSGKFVSGPTEDAYWQAVNDTLVNSRRMNEANMSKLETLGSVLNKSDKDIIEDVKSVAVARKILSIRKASIGYAKRTESASIDNREETRYAR